MPQGKTRDRASRARRREALLCAADAIELAQHYDVVVLGGGAAGLVAGICAAEQGAKALVLEADVECGRSILATGNGRCNFANTNLDPRRYNDAGFVRAAFGERALEDILAFFSDCGLRWAQEEDRLYPRSRRAASLRNVLLARARRAGVTLGCARRADEARRTEGGFCVGFTQELPEGSARRGSLLCSSLVLAYGGTDASVAAGLGLELHERHPVLCPLSCEDSPLLTLDGRRAQARVTLVREGQKIWDEEGELLIRSYGLSGIVIFDLSRRAHEGDELLLDLASELAHDELLDLVDPKRRGRFVPGCLDGVLDPDIASLLEGLAYSSEELAGLAKGFRLRALGTADEAHAQVRRGGLACSQFAAQDLSCTSAPGLFACGEALDIDADCGGFNLAWAWKSGMLAGSAAAGQTLGKASH